MPGNGLVLSEAVAYVWTILTWGGGYSANFLRSVIFPFLRNDENNGYLNDIKFIFGRCHRSWAAETPGKYEHDWKYLTYTFAKSKFPVTEKLTNGALVTPTPSLHPTLVRRGIEWLNQIPRLVIDFLKVTTLRNPNRTISIWNTFLFRWQPTFSSRLMLDNYMLCLFYSA